MAFVKFKLLRPGAKMPTRGTDGSGAFDFYAPERIVLLPGHKRLVSSGIAHDLRGELYMQTRPTGLQETSDHLHCGIPFRLQGILFDRSGLGGKKDVRISFACLIDNDYRGEILIKFENEGEETQTWEPGDRLCQILYVLAYSGGAEETRELTTTERGAGGFGSTGV